MHKCNCCCSNNTEKPVLEDVCDQINNCDCKNMISTMSGCGFNSQEIFPTNPMLAQSYVPIQYLDKTFTPACGLKNGTIFPELVTTYYPGQSMMTLDYLRMDRGGMSNV